MIPSSIKGPAVDAFAPIIERLGSPEAGFDLRLLAPVWLDRPEGEFIDEAILQHVAWGLDIDILGLDYSQKVARIKGAIALHRRRGTKWAIRKELEVLGFVAVSVQEGNAGVLVHDGSGDHDGSGVHGGQFDEWAVFRVAMLGVRGFDSRLVLQAIEKAKNARAKLIGLTITLRYSMSLSTDIATLKVNCVQGDFTASFVPENYLFFFDVPVAFSARNIEGLTALDSGGQSCGEVVFPASVTRGGYSVRIIVDVDRNLGTSAAFDSPDVPFDDNSIQLDD